ncbi:MAG: 30S ribosomal protein S18 [Patescibacteria group bacterium]|nr:30S ribosomal protein S18 [Patescibacteria group bacterium]
MIKNRKKPCKYCIAGEKEIDYKDIKSIQKFINQYGKIDPKKRSGLCPKHQRKMSTAIKRARIMALLPYIAE